MPLVQIGEQQRADRAADEGEREQREGIEGARERIHEREDEGREYEDRRQGVDEEIEEFAGPSDDDSDRNFARLDGVMRADQLGIPFQRSRS